MRWNEAPGPPGASSFRHWGAPFGVSLVLIAVLGCSVSPGQSPDSSPTSIVPPASGAEKPVDPALPFPSGFVLPPILDPDGAGPPYSRDEPVQAGSLTVIYRGTTQADGRYIARFDVTGPLQSPAGALFFLPSGPSVGLDPVGGGVVSEPFRLSGGADPSTLFAWLVGTETLVWELGLVSN